MLFRSLFALTYSISKCQTCVSLISVTQKQSKDVEETFEKMCKVYGNLGKEVCNKIRPRILELAKRYQNESPERICTRVNLCVRRPAIARAVDAEANFNPLGNKCDACIFVQALIGSFGYSCSVVLGMVSSLCPASLKVFCKLFGSKQIQDLANWDKRGYNAFDGCRVIGFC